MSHTLRRPTAFGCPGFHRAHGPSRRVLLQIGVRGRQVRGSSDRLAAYPATNPVSPADLTATLYHALGLRAETTLTAARPPFAPDAGAGGIGVVRVIKAKFRNYVRAKAGVGMRNEALCKALYNKAW
jgi:hypothetical protein